MLDWDRPNDEIYLTIHFKNAEDRIEVQHLVQKYFNRKEKESNMEDYKLRMVKEYKELKEIHTELYNMTVKYDAGKLDFKPKCPIDLLKRQTATLWQYLYILETRAAIEDIDLHSED